MSIRYLKGRYALTEVAIFKVLAKRQGLTTTNNDLVPLVYQVLQRPMPYNARIGVLAATRALSDKLERNQEIVRLVRIPMHPKTSFDIQLIGPLNVPLDTIRIKETPVRRTTPKARRDSKRTICAKLLLRPQGATREELLAATGWPTISVQDVVSRTGMALATLRTGRCLTYRLVPAISNRAKSQLRTAEQVVDYIRSQRGLCVRVAKACRIHRAAVYQWDVVPSIRVSVVAKLIGLTPKQVRPDLDWQ